MEIRDAVVEDVKQMSTFLKELTASGKRTSPDDESFVRAYYIEDSGKIRCSVAVDEGVILGFQSLKLAEPDNKWGVEPGWGIIGTHIRPSAARRGVGRALFEESRLAAENAGIGNIDASIAATNPEALAYYEAMGFRTYRTPDGLICKRFAVAKQSS
ncbi:GNAT family N-acetyltransferase [Roseinatronobacter sp. S2]|uniref:GNAT family N-acetyltransferase n=1 Tax=Roseinatronobacter sp. S2 TaxID=3035471 RepID=UPI00240F2030|nr:GNAT family N-acetyltransferase [Roseinatronobacter sp. S2]WFE75836.1 GNAT family N-acetyltransferase [Roseinatronobacter sp. S2]